MQGILNKLVIGVVLGAAVMVGMGIYSDFSETARLLQAFRWEWLLVILGMTAVNYGLRFAKWHYYLHQIGVSGVTVWDNLRIFLGGFSLSLTPGKTGELAKTIWLQNTSGVHPARTAPMILAERLSDGIALALLALLGGFLYPEYRPLLLATGGALLVAAVAVQFRPFMTGCLEVCGKIPLAARAAHHLHALYESAYELLKMKNLLAAVSLGFAAWLIQGGAFYLILVGLGMPVSGDLFLLAVFILSFGMIAGGVSGMPGGLGVAEGSLAGMLHLLAGAPEGVAVAATLLIRFCVLWAGVIAGMVVILVWRRFLFGLEKGAGPDMVQS